MIKILAISDIHANFPALWAIDQQTPATSFDLIVNCGDSLVYGPFPNETLAWLRRHKVISILGNTDIKVLKLLKGKSFKKPGKAEKRIMYSWTAAALTAANQAFLKKIPKTKYIKAAKQKIGLFHGSPANPQELLSKDTTRKRLEKLFLAAKCQIIITGHSHSPYKKNLKKVTFLNPGSVGRMFDGNPAASYAIIKLHKNYLQIKHYRCDYDPEIVCRELRKQKLPPIYEKMFRRGNKLN